MIGSRWLKAAARAAVGLVAVLPAVALVSAALVDRGPDGHPRVSPFPIGLLAFDPFTRTCLRNSLIFAVTLTGLSVIAGVGLGGMLPGRSRRGWLVTRLEVSSMLAAAPAVLALGMRGLGPWSGFLSDWSRLNLEAWSGWPLWGLWIWSGAPTGVALVALATANARDRLRLTWEDVARLAGAGPLRSWWRVAWPLVRPSVARAAAIVFPLALLEPGAPLILGLRRTLAFQVVEAAARPDPFPRVAIWTAMAAGCSLVGRWLLLRWGGPHRLEDAVPADRPAAGSWRGVLPGILVLGLVVLAWLPAVGLLLALRTADVPGLIRMVTQPPIPRIIADSLIVGVEVGVPVLFLAWLLRPGPGSRHASTYRSRMVGRFALMPPMVQGAGVLALLALLPMGLGALRGISGDPAWFGRLGEEVSLYRHPRAILAAAVGLSVGLRCLASWRRAAERRPDESRSSLDAAVLAGFSPGRARSIAATRRRRWAGILLLTMALAAVNLAPALLFTPWMDGRTAAPALLRLADGGDEDRRQAAILGLLVIAGNLAGLCAARLAPAPPPEWDPDPP